MRPHYLTLVLLTSSCAAQPAPCPTAAPPPPAATETRRPASSGLYDVTIFANNVAELSAFYHKLGFEMAFVRPSAWVGF